MPAISAGYETRPIGVFALKCALMFGSSARLHLRNRTYSPTRSEFQARGEVESVAFDGVADVEIVYPAGVKIQVALTNLRRIDNNRADSERAPDKPVEPVR